MNAVVDAQQHESSLSHPTITVAQRSRLYAAALFALYLAGSLAIYAIYFTPHFPVLRLPFSYLLLPLLVAAFGLSIGLYRQAEGRLPWLPAALGVIVLGGGALFDSLSTISHTPLLENEGNPIAIVMLESGHSVAAVYLYSILGQTLLVLASMVQWAAFLRHRPSLLQLLRESRPGSVWRFLLPRRRPELPAVYLVLWPCLVFPLAGTGLYRWYLGLEWWNVVQTTAGLDLLPVAALFGVTVYIIWLLWEYRAYRATIAPARRS